MSKVIKANLLKDELFFTEDSYIINDLFFLPKNTKVKKYHLELINQWNIEQVTSEGDLMGLDMPVSKEEGVLDVFDHNENIIDIARTDPANKESESEEVPEKIDVLQSFKEIYKRWIISIINFFNSIINNKTIDKQKVINLLQDIEQFINKDKDSALMLFEEKFDGILIIYKQTLETIILSYGLAEQLDLKEFAKINLVLGALFHDLGMLKIPRAILQKKEKLSREEITAIQNHTVIGYQYLREVKYSAIIASGALQHHERLDGKGYPAHIKSEKITQIGKIVGVVDAYCAAIAEKPFRSPLHAKEALQDLLKKGGVAYDTQILKALINVISFYPVGSLVLLSNNLPARVIGSSKIAMRPIVKIATEDNHEIIDLSIQTDIYIKGVYQNSKIMKPK